MGTSLKMDSIHHYIKKAALPPVSETQTHKSWISDASWWLVDQLNALRKLPEKMCFTVHCLLSWSLKASFQENRKQQVATAGAIAKMELSEGNTREAWQVIQSWFIAVENWSLPPSWEALRKVTNDCINKLYSKDLPPDKILILVAPFDDVDNVVPEADEIAEAVGWLRNGKAPGPSKFRIEHLVGWLGEATRDEDPDSGIGTE